VAYGFVQCTSPTRTNNGTNAWLCNSARRMVHVRSGTDSMPSAQVLTRNGIGSKDCQMRRWRSHLPQECAIPSEHRVTANHTVAPRKWTRLGSPRSVQPTSISHLRLPANMACRFEMQQGTALPVRLEQGLGWRGIWVRHLEQYSVRDWTDPV